MLEKRRRRQFASSSETRAIARRTGQAPPPLSFAQQRLWVVDQLQPGTNAYNLPMAHHLKGSLDVTALSNCLNEVIARHEILRTTFQDFEGLPVQIIAPPCLLQLPLVDLRECPEAERSIELRRLITELAEQPFDLARGPLLRVCLLRLEEDEHVLSLTMHHIISDDWSIGVMSREIGAIYKAFSSGEPSPLADLDIQYADFAQWQRQWLQGEVFEAHILYWRRQLEGAPATLELPTDYPRPAIQTHRGAYYHCALPNAVAESLKAMSLQEGVTLFMTLLAAFQALLYRYTAQEIIPVGTPIAGRNRVETEGLIGFFVNTLVMCTRVAGELSFRELLARVKEVAIGAYANQDLPFELLVERLQPERTLSHAPLFQVMFLLQNNAKQVPEFSNLTLSGIDLEGTTSKFDLTLGIIDSPGEMTAVFEFNTNLFEAASIERMAGHFEKLLEAITTSHEQKVSELPMLTPLESRQILIDWNDTDREYSRGVCIHQLIEQQAQRTPGGTAVIFEGRHMTYAELDARANQLANYLRQSGAGPETLVAVCLDRSFEMVIALLAVLKSGGAYVPIEPTYPGNRISFILKDSRAAIVLTEERFKKDLPECDAHLICLDSCLPEIATQSTSSPVSRVADENAMYVIYTSGSTGSPKGAINTHRGLRNRLLWMQDAYRLTCDDRVLQKTPYSFDVSVWEFFWPLMTGATMVGAKPRGHQDSAYLAKLIAEQKITTLHFVPSMLQVFLEEESLELCTSLRNVICSGEALPHDLQQRFFEKVQARLHNLYGPTEASIDVSYWPCAPDSNRLVVPIGRPIANTQLYVLDGGLRPVPIGVAGELYIAGEGLARTYLNRPDMTAEKFLPNPFGKQPGARMYKTGDVARYMADGAIVYLGRTDHQVKIRGLRIELGEIESVVASHPAVREAVVVVTEEAAGEKRIVSYVTARQGETLSVTELRRFIKEALPEYMVPAAFVELETLPLTSNGKVDRRALQQVTGLKPQLESAYVAPRNELEELITGVWREVLRVEKVGVNDNFFDLGGHSLLLVQVHNKLRKLINAEMSVIKLFQFPTISSLAEHLAQQEDRKTAIRNKRDNGRAEPERLQQSGARKVSGSSEAIAIVGMAGRFPGARNVKEFWENLKGGVESISFFSEQELLDSGMDATLLNDPNYVRAGGILKDVELFDAPFFGFNPREADITDPQHRLFLECAWEALEQAGYNSETYGGSIGVYAGISMSSYFLMNLQSNPEVMSGPAGFQVMVGNDKDFLATRVSYKLNLKGPSLTVQTACSTSLVATHLACQSLLNGECDMALSGGVSVSIPQKKGYLYQEGGIASPDGHCRAFDHRAQGTVSGNGVGVVVLKRLSKALADGDQIYAVIKGSSINNDGSIKIGYTAPSVGGQAEVIAAAQAQANVDPETITYIEAHGTGTPLGDPIELAALTNVFNRATDKKSFCAIGSVKTNIGHLDAAAGVAGLIKTTLALHHKVLPASLHFERPNPNIDFLNSPFYVNTSTSEWKASSTPRRAGVSSFGIGGTNAHVVVEESPAVEASAGSKPWNLLVLSAKSRPALEAASTNLARHLKENPGLNISDVAYTLQVGRRKLPHRRTLVCSDLQDAASMLEGANPARISTSEQEARSRNVIFMFPGQGTQYVNMGLELYEQEPYFREQIDLCSEILKPHLGLDLNKTLYPDEASRAEAARLLRQTDMTQPALFVIEYALARTYMNWGVRPDAMIGHSIGEYVAACLAGVFTVEDALRLVARRGRLMQGLPRGAMLAVWMAERELTPMLGDELSAAAVNGPSMCVVSGPLRAIEEFERRLEGGTKRRRLPTSHAFHSSMTEPILDEFRALVRGLRLNAPKITYISNVTGTWITPEQATDASYWADHLRKTVRFSEGLREATGKAGTVLLEVGPGQTLGKLARQQAEKDSELVIISSMKEEGEAGSAQERLLKAIGKLWLADITIGWGALYDGERRRRVELPTYPFEKARYWIEPKQPSTEPASRGAGPERKADISDWFYVPCWKQSPLPGPLDSSGLITEQTTCIVFKNEHPLADRLTGILNQRGAAIITVTAGDRFYKINDKEYEINPKARKDYEALLKQLRIENKSLVKIIHLWSLMTADRANGLEDSFERSQEMGFYSLLHLAQTIGKLDVNTPVEIEAVTNGSQALTGTEVLIPDKATILAPCKVIPQEYPNVRCRIIDVEVYEDGHRYNERLIEQLVEDLRGKSTDLEIAYRGNYRWVRTYDALRLESHTERASRLKEGGVYLITGGLGGVGLVLAEHLARAAQAKLVLIGRGDFPERSQWERLLDERDSDDEISRKIRRLRAVEELGAEALVLKADVADELQMRRAVAKAVERFGAIDGVIHAAGVAGGGIIQRQTAEAISQVLAPKVKGVQVLDRLFSETKLDFFALFSSQRSILGGIGRIDYCAANAFLDLFAHSKAFTSATPVISANWDTWRDAGMAVNAAAQYKLNLVENSPEGISAGEGGEAFSRIISSGLPQVIISVKDFNAALEQSRALTVSSLLEADNISLFDSAEIQVRQSHPRPRLETDYVAPRNKTEQLMAEIWQELLGIEEVGVYDNFIELGGDSVLSIQIISRAGKVGIRLTPKQIFEYQTIAELAEVAEEAKASQAEQGPVTGPVPLTPIQRWFFEQGLAAPDYYNQAVLLEVRRQLSPSNLQRAAHHLLSHHDALRLRFNSEDNVWRQVNAELEDDTPFLCADLSMLTQAEQRASVEAEAARLQRSLDLTEGPIMRVCLFRLGADRTDRLLIVVHHLAVDAISWRFLLEDLQTGYEQASAGQGIKLLPKTTPFKQWAWELERHSRSAEIEQEIDYWLAEERRGVNSLPVDYFSRRNVVAYSEVVPVELDEEETRALLQEVPRTYHTQINEVLLTALAQAFWQWTGEKTLLVNLEGHGREGFAQGLDVSRTAGWFTTIFPVLLELNEPEDAGASLREIKERVRKIPNNGIGHGLLRYMRGDAELAQKLSAMPQAEVSFLYLGQLDQVLSQDSPFSLAQESTGPSLDLLGARPHLLDVICSIVGGKLRVNWTYSLSIHERATVERLARYFIESLRSLIAHCQSTDAACYTPSDIAEFSWSEQDIDQIMSKISKSID
ncbi:MAG: amino acid adenylation domain-containing protein [Blastocatellia bacterium]